LSTGTLPVKKKTTSKNLGHTLLITKNGVIDVKLDLYIGKGWSYIDTYLTPVQAMIPNGEKV
jgi:hypothetical protein